MAVSTVEDSTEITELLRKASRGDKDASRQLFPLLYNELKRLPAGHLHGHWNLTLSATALVHEASLRVADLDGQTYADRTHFFGIASRIMRNVLVDLVRQSRAQKRGAGLTIQLADNSELQHSVSNEVLLLDEALTKMAKEHPRAAHIIEMKYFGGMTADEMALSLQLSEVTIGRDVRFAQAWLRRELAPKSA